MDCLNLRSHLFNRLVPNLAELLYLRCFIGINIYIYIYILSDYHQSQTQTSNKECNCRKKDQCPLDGKCLTQNVVYQATVTTQTSSKSYVGLATNFKDRYRNHTASFRHESKRNETELSKHIWTLQDTNKPFSIKWSVDLTITLTTNVIYVFLKNL